MKKLLTLALVLSSATAFATRSRITALGNSPHLVDVATVYVSPSDIMSLGDSLTIESGKTLAGTAIATTDTNTTTAEGLMIRSMGDSKFALSLGHSDDSIFAMRSSAVSMNPAVTTIRQQNPLELSYGMKTGDMAVAGTLIYSNFQDKSTTAPQKENSMGLKAGVTAGALKGSLAVIFADNWETGTAGTDYKGNTSIAATVGYDVMSDLYVYGAVSTGGYKAHVTTATTLDYTSMTVKVGVVSTIKKDATEFFYGAGLTYQDQKEKGTAGSERTIKDTHMPLIIGLEAEANSWLVLRGSITQNLLLVDSSKDETAPAAPTVDTNPGANSTALAAGAGLKFNKISVDGSILAAGSQVLNSANLLGQVGLTYAF